jgi:hypothetical protein
MPPPPTARSAVLSRSLPRSSGFRDASGNPSMIPRIRVNAALDGLDQAADEAAAEFG